MKTPRFWQHNGWQAVLLTPISWIYGAITQWRLKRIQPYHSKAKVICIGNITAGGVGKTPVALAMAEQYIASGKKVVFVTRGYKSKLKNIVVDLTKHSAVETGDEARLLALVAPTVIAPNRAEGAKIAERLGAEIIIMDDGFQNPQLYKDESWLVFDGASGVGNGKIIPAGPLRETLEHGQKRAQYILIMGDDKTHLAQKCQLPVYYGKLEAQPLELTNRRVLAFAGIGHPEKFYQTLRENGFEVILTHGFADHYAYQPKDIEVLVKEAEEQGLTLITTEKDFVKLSAEDKNRVAVLKVRAIWDK